MGILWHPKLRHRDMGTPWHRDVCTHSHAHMYVSVCLGGGCPQIPTSMGLSLPWVHRIQQDQSKELGLG